MPVLSRFYGIITDLHIDSDPFTIELEYSNGERVKVNFKPIIDKGGVMSSLNNVDFFKRVSIGNKGCWNQGGSLDIILN